MEIVDFICTSPFLKRVPGCLSWSSPRFSGFKPSVEPVNGPRTGTPALDWTKTESKSRYFTPTTWIFKKGRDLYNNIHFMKFQKDWRKVSTRPERLFYRNESCKRMYLYRSGKTETLLSRWTSVEWIKGVGRKEIGRVVSQAQYKRISSRILAVKKLVQNWRRLSGVHTSRIWRLGITVVETFKG